MVDERCELLAECFGVFLAQVDLVLRAAEPESHGLIGRAAIEIVFQCDCYLLCHLRLLAAIATCTVQDQLLGAVIDVDGLSSRRVEPRRREFGDLHAQQSWLTCAGGQPKVSVTSSRVPW
jgi:hypothetical protein